MSTAPKGFRFATACAGFRKEGRADLALLVSDVPAVAAGTFTQNRFPAAPVLVAKAMLAERPAARAVVINSGQANACTGDEGMRNCRTTQELVAGALGLEASDILPASTGVIGAQLKMGEGRPRPRRQPRQGDPGGFCQGDHDHGCFPQDFAP